MRKILPLICASLMTFCSGAYAGVKDNSVDNLYSKFDSAPIIRQVKEAPEQSPLWGRYEDFVLGEAISLKRFGNYDNLEGKLREKLESQMFDPDFRETKNLYGQFFDLYHDAIVLRTNIVFGYEAFKLNKKDIQREINEIEQLGTKEDFDKINKLINEEERFADKITLLEKQKMLADKLLGEINFYRYVSVQNNAHRLLNFAVPYNLGDAKIKLNEFESSFFGLKHQYNKITEMPKLDN